MWYHRAGKRAHAGSDSAAASRYPAAPTAEADELGPFCLVMSSSVLPLACVAHRRRSARMRIPLSRLLHLGTKVVPLIKAATLLSRKIRVNAINLGAIDTPTHGVTRDERVEPAKTAARHVHPAGSSRRASRDRSSGSLSCKRRIALHICTRTRGPWWVRTAIGHPTGSGDPDDAKVRVLDAAYSGSDMWSGIFNLRIRPDRCGRRAND